jgi:hypothetical protein
MVHPMYEHFLNALVLAVYAYVTAGALVALVIVSFGLTRLDSEAEHAGIGLRALVFPGAVALWPILLKRYLLGGGQPPIQKDPHR